MNNNKIDDDEAFIQSLRQKASSLNVSYSSPAAYTSNTIKRNSIKSIQSGTNFEFTNDNISPSDKSKNTQSPLSQDISHSPSFINSPSHNDKFITLDNSLTNTTLSTTDPNSLCKIYRKENSKLREDLENSQKEVLELRTQLKETIEENEKATDMLYTELENYRRNPVNMKYVNDLATNHKYELRDLQNEYNDNIRRIENRHQSDMEFMKEKYQLEINKYNFQVNTLRAEVEELQKKNVNPILDATQKSFILNSNEYHELQGKMNELSESKNKEIELLNSKLHTKENDIQILQEHVESLDKENESLKDKINELVEEKNNIQEMDELPPIPDMNKEILNDNENDNNTSSLSSSSFLLSKYMKENEELKEQLNELLENKDNNNNNNNNNDSKDDEDNDDNENMKEELDKYANYIHELENTINVKDEQINKLEQQVATMKIDENNTISNNNNNNNSELITPRSSPNNSGTKLTGSNQDNNSKRRNDNNTVESETETDPTNYMLEKINEYEELYNNLQRQNEALTNRIKELENRHNGEEDSLVMRENNSENVEKYLDMIRELEEEKQRLLNENESLMSSYADLKMKYENTERRRISSTGPSTANENEEENENENGTEDNNNIDPIVLEKIKELKNQISIYEAKFNQISEEIPNHGINIDRYRQVLEDNDYLKAELQQNEKERMKLLNIIQVRLDEIKKKAEGFSNEDFNNLMEGYNELVDNYSKSINNNNNINLISKNVSSITQKIQLMNIIDQLSSIIDIKYNGDGYNVDEISSFLLNVIQYITQLHHEVEDMKKEITEIESNNNVNNKDKEIKRLNSEIETLLSNTTVKQNYSLLQENKELKMKLNELCDNISTKDLFYNYYHSNEGETEYSNNLSNILYRLRTLNKGEKNMMLKDICDSLDDTCSTVNESRLQVKEILLKLNNEIKFVKEKLNNILDEVEIGNLDVSEEAIKSLKDLEQCVTDFEELV